ncbi:NAD(P)(+) transhydrogenase (Re/Si-specific) subunit beta [Pontiella sulfatireligans]|uniref:NAD(P) transhydrogenase subunit beta n=1 Tax=Pontiella sulfatireligans TaxID=2750658 RepID=A0A6C2UIR4_9BACT|nr:NAD(P)(+) transhydrogenase (Re/Si-specific) subunit beta [Pontiella sulfatireligans]VGO19849.1 NAD(P) transhydrogenase subunit beta [Pontiella sulfatireligans]
MMLINLAYLIAAILFILGLKGLGSPRSAPRGNMLGAVGMLIAIIATLINKEVMSYTWIIAGIVVGSAIGAIMAKRVQMTQMPEMVALFNGFGGAASLLVALSEYSKVAGHYHNALVADAGMAAPQWSVALLLSAIIGAVTLTGSIVAWAKLQGYADKAMQLPNQSLLRAGLGLVLLVLCAWFVVKPEMGIVLYAIALVALLLGILLVIAIGGADMPVVIALLNSYSGLAAAATGFVLNNNGLIISGSLVGASGIILSKIMCKAMNRSLGAVLFGGAMVSDEQMANIPGKEFYEGKVKSCGAEEVAMLLENAQKVVIAPGYGLAVAQAQHVTQELADLLEKRGVEVKFAIHPVAGRMPGHMNVLLAEAEVPYDKLVEMDNINPEFSQTDVTIVLGANDVTNPAARDDKTSPIYGMPILEVDKSRTVIVIKRSLSPGFAGIPNQLFINDNSLMLFGDAKAVLQDLTRAVMEL